MQQVKEQIAELSRKQACRPHDPQYGRLFQELQHYLCSIGQASAVEDLLSHLLKALQVGLAHVSIHQYEFICWKISIHFQKYWK